MAGSMVMEGRNGRGLGANMDSVSPYGGAAGSGRCHSANTVFFKQD